MSRHVEVLRALQCVGSHAMLSSDDEVSIALSAAIAALEAKESESLALASARGRVLELEAALRKIRDGALSDGIVWQDLSHIAALAENALNPPPPASPSIRDGTEHHDAAPPEGADEEPQEHMDVLLTWLKPPSGDGDAGDR